MRRYLFMVAACLAALSVGLAGQEWQWFKGNTHTHTVNSDGDELPRRVVKEDHSQKPTYSFTGTETYVRARVFSSHGEFACTQPYFPRKNK